MSDEIREQLARHEHIQGPFRASGTVFGYRDKEDRLEAMRAQINACLSFFL